MTLVLILVGYPVSLLVAWLRPHDKGGREDAVNPKAMPTDKPSIAVLTLKNLSEDKQRDYFAQGMTEDLVAGLSRSRHFLVKSRTSSVPNAAEEVDLVSLGKNLGVKYLVDGSVRPMGDRVRISVRLSETERGSSLWAERYDRPIDQLFEIQDEVIAEITSVIGSTVTRAESTRAASLTPSSLSAWEAVQRASFYRGADGNSEEQTNQSIDELRRAVDEDPGYAYAHSMLAWILSYRALNGLSDTPGQDYDEASEHLQKGLALAADDAFNLSICGGAVGYLGDYEKSIELCNKALAVDPNYSDAFFNLSSAYQHLERFEEAHQALDKVVRMAPHGPMSRYYDWYRANILVAEGRYEEAEPFIRATIDKAPSYTSPYLYLVGVLSEQGRLDEAENIFKQVTAVNPRLSAERFRARRESQQHTAPGRKFLLEMWRRG